jgi:O-antigen/teichoic acid export membrane protein
MSFYGMAWSASRVAPQILGQALGFVLVPALARIRTDKQRVGRALNESVRHSYLLLAPVAAGLFVSAPSLVTTVLGSKWLPMVPCLRVMCVSVLTVPFIQACSALLIGTGLAHLSGIAATIHLLVLIVLVRPLALNWGILGAAFADLVGVVALTSSLFFISRLKARGVAWEFSSLAMPITAALGAGFITWWVGSYVSVGLVRLLLEASVVIAAYVLAISVLGGRSRLNDVTNLLRGVMRRGMAQPDAGR